MAAKKYLARIAGRFKQIAAVVVSAGAANDGDLVALGADGKLDASLMPAGFGQNTIPAVAAESLAAHDVVNLYNNAGTINVRKADATAEGKEANGFVTAAYALGASATVYTEGNILSGMSGLTPGARYYLSTTPGQVTAVPVSAAGNVDQCVGVAASDTTLVFAPEDPVTL